MTVLLPLRGTLLPATCAASNPGPCKFAPELLCGEVPLPPACRCALLGREAPVEHRGLTDLVLLDGRCLLPCFGALAGRALLGCPLSCGLVRAVSEVED